MHNNRADRVRIPHAHRAAQPTNVAATVAPQGFTVWALSRNPDAQMMVKSYGNQFAQEHSAAARKLIADTPEVVGIELAEDKKAVGRWRVEGHKGGMLAGGIKSSTTGRGKHPGN